MKIRIYLKTTIGIVALATIGFAANAQTTILTSILPTAHLLAVNVSDTNTAIYPNPANTEVNIVLKSSIQTGTIKVFDVTGRQIQSAGLKNGRVLLNTTSYYNGVYIYRITDADGTVINTGKFHILH